MPRDIISIPRIALLHPNYRDKVTTAIDNVEKSFPSWITVRIAQGLRTFPEQDALYAIGRTKPGKIVTQAKAGQSLHNFGLAIDFVIMIDRDRNGTFEEISWDRFKDEDHDKIADWQEVVKAFEAVGASWGGDWRTFKDYPHCEFNSGHDYHFFLNQYTANQFLPVPGKYVSQA